MITALLLGFSLALDCFAIALSQGLALATTPVGKQKLLNLALCFGFFQGGMLLMGYGGSHVLLAGLAQWTHIIAALLLWGIGGKMIWESRSEEHENQPLQRIRDYVALSVATSIDALAAGITLPALQVVWWQATLLVGFTSFGLGLLGGLGGKRLGAHLGERAELFGGLVLIGLGFKAIFAT